MEGRTGVERYYSWPVILMILVVFWPAGVFLIIKKLEVDKAAVMNMGKKLQVASWVFYGLAAYGLLLGSAPWPTVIFLGLAGYVLGKISKKTEAEAKNVREYVGLIINENVRSLNEIAGRLGKPVNEVKTDIQGLMGRGYLLNAYINEAAQTIVFPSESGYGTNRTAPYPNPARTSGEARGERAVQCPCCGANNIVCGESGKCEYCGSVIK